MGQLLSLAVPITDDPETSSFYNRRCNCGSVNGPTIPLVQTLSKSLIDVRSSTEEREMDMKDPYSIYDYENTIGTPSEFLDTEPMLCESSVRSNMLSICSSINRGRFREIAEKFVAFEFLLYSCVISVMSYNLGYKRDAKYDYFHAPTAAARIAVSEEYYRGVIQNGYHSLMQIEYMALRDILPALEKIRSVDKFELEMYKKEYDELAADCTQVEYGGGLLDDVQSPGENQGLNNIVIVSTPSVMTALERHHRPISGALGSRSPTSRQNKLNNIPHEHTPLGVAEEEIINAEVFHPDPARLAIFNQLSGKDIDVPKSKCHCNIVNESTDFLNNSDSVAQLNRGDGYFFFSCKSLSQCSKENVDYFGRFINLTSFDDEERQNACPVVDVHDEEVQTKYISIMVKSMYILPGVKHTDISAELMSTKEYNKACQYGDINMLDTDEPLTFRQKKTIVKYIFSLVIQFKVSNVTDPEELRKFTTVDGITPSRIVLLERTKRNIHTEDSTVKCKSVLLYYQVDHGILVSHTTVILNRAIPVIVSKLMDSFGGRGSLEAGETANNTRKYLIQKFGDMRKNRS